MQVTRCHHPQHGSGSDSLSCNYSLSRLLHLIYSSFIRQKLTFNINISIEATNKLITVDLMKLSKFTERPR
jgi:hypothetical protein